MRWKSDREDEFFYLKLALMLAVVVNVIAGLIEWNARRQAAAFTRELMRPATLEELRQVQQMFPIEPLDGSGTVRKRSNPKPVVTPHSTPLGHPRPRQKLLMRRSMSLNGVMIPCSCTNAASTAGGTGRRGRSGRLSANASSRWMGAVAHVYG